MFGTRVPKRFVDIVPGAQTIPAREIAAIDSLTTPVQVEEGRVLMRQGAPGNEALFVLEGELLIERDGEAVAVVGPGSIVGEAALIANQPRNATVTAASDVKAMAMTRREFATIIDRCPVAARRILQAAVGRVGSNVQ
jgi:CRP-like cAMP-binding protein